MHMPVKYICFLGESVSMSATTWSDPNHCPFCGIELENPGAGFVDHIGTSEDCESGFEMWRGNIAGDMGGSWSG